MKRATLTAYPTTPPAEPGDLTDRLLEREENRSAGALRKRRVRQAGANPAGRKVKPAAPEALAAPTAPDSNIEMALVSAEVAAAALRQAAREAPARYDVALRYRLDALAHHLQQVKEFVTALAAR
jgi:hypothetical protein